MRLVGPVGAMVLGLAAALFGQLRAGGEFGTFLEPMPAATTSAPATRSRTTAASAPAEQKDYVHPGTRMKFPVTLVDFERTDVTKFTPDESDVGVSYLYLDQSLPIIASIYVFPAPVVQKADGETDEQMKKRRFQKALDAIKMEIAGYYKDATVTAEAEFAFKEGDRTHRGVKVTYALTRTFGGKTMPATSDMYLFVEGAWQIEYRFSYRKASAERSQDHVEKMMGALKWGRNE